MFERISHCPLHLATLGQFGLVLFSTEEGAFGFVDVQGGERLFMPARSYIGQLNGIREGMEVIVSEIGGVREAGKKRVAGRVEPL